MLETAATGFPLFAGNASFVADAGCDYFARRKAKKVEAVYWRELVFPMLAMRRVNGNNAAGENAGDLA